MYWYTFTAHYYIVVNVGVIDPDRERGRLSSDIPLDASNVLHLSMNCLSSIVLRVRRGTLPLLSSTAEDRSPAERFGVVDGELSQICLGNFRGSDSAAAIP